MTSQQQAQFVLLTNSTNISQIYIVLLIEGRLHALTAARRAFFIAGQPSARQRQPQTVANGYAFNICVIAITC